MNDQAAFAELRARHQSDATRSARIVAHDPDEADRIVDAAFERLHTAQTAGDGPRTAVSPYLRTMIRRGALDAHRTAGDEYEAADPAAVEDLPHTTDPLDAVEGRNVIREAYESLPERWQRALWFTEIEGRMPAALVPDLGSAARAVAAMAYRAREGLRQAYLAVHMSVAVSAECQPVVAKLPAYVREALSPEDDVTVAIHLDTCVDCRNRRYELLLLVSNLRNVLAPALLGYRAGTPAATRPVAGLGAAAAGVAVRRVARTSAVAAMTAVRWPHRAVKVAATAAGCVLAAAALVWAASSAFAPTTSADAAGGDRGDPLTVTFEQTDEPPPAVTMNPLDLLDGLPEENEDDPDGAAPTAENTGEEPAASGDTGRTQDGPLAAADDEASAEADSNNNTSGSAPEESSTTDSAGGGAAAGAGGGSSGNGAGSGGNQSPPDGSDSDPGQQPAPPAGNDDGDSDDDADEPTDNPDESPDEEQDEPGIVEKILCLVLC